MNDPHRGLPVVHAGARVDECRAAVIMIHGRNSSPSSILELIPRLGCSDCAYLAPTAANRSWYPVSFMSELEKNEPSLTSALGVLEALVADLAARGVPKSRVVLLGFSQGACLAAEFSRRDPQFDERPPLVLRFNDTHLVRPIRQRARQHLHDRPHESDHRPRAAAVIW